MTLDHASRTITVGGAVVRLTRQGFDLCAYLADHPGWVRSRVQIMEAIGIGLHASDRAVDTIVKRARQAGVTQIKTSAGVGYYWDDG